MFLILLLACAETGALPAVTVEVCGGGVSVAQSGFAGTEPEPADGHAETYGTEPSPYHVRLSWASDPSTSATLLWRTDGETLASRVEYGTDASYGRVADGGSFHFAGAEDAGRVHEVELCGLEPGTTYRYRVGGEGGWSDGYTFTTAPAAGGDEPFVFGVAGDSRGDQAVWAQILDAMEAHAPDFHLFTGDAVILGSDLEEWGAWLDAGAGHLESRAVVLAHGNHEFYAQPYFALVAQPGDERTFSFDYADAHFAVLDDSAAPDGRASQAAWLEDDLAATTRTWRFALHHKPAYTSSTVHGSDEEIRALWSPVEEAHGVALDLTGHNHNYERSAPLLGGVEVSEAEGTTYLVTGGAGAPLYDNDMAQPFTRVAHVGQHYVIVQVDGGEATVTAYDLVGNVLDRFTLSR